MDSNYYKVCKFSVLIEYKVSFLMKNNKVYVFNRYKYMLLKLYSHYNKDCTLNMRKNKFLFIEE